MQKLNIFKSPTLWPYSVYRQTYNNDFLWEKSHSINVLAKLAQQTPNFVVHFNFYFCDFSIYLRNSCARGFICVSFKLFFLYAPNEIKQILNVMRSLKKCNRENYIQNGEAVSENVHQRIDK